jgi:hypothetical protein
VSCILFTTDASFTHMSEQVVAAQMVYCNNSAGEWASNGRIPASPGVP